MAGVIAVSASVSASAEEPKVVAVSAFAANPAAAPQAPAVESLFGGLLADARELKVITHADLQTLVSVERQKQLLGDKGECNENCMIELAGAVGAQYVVSGRIDRFGDAYVLAADVFDAHAAKVLLKARANAAGDAEIPEATRELAAQAVRALGATLSAVASSNGTGQGHRAEIGEWAASNAWASSTNDGARAEASNASAAGEAGGGPPAPDDPRVSASTPGGPGVSTGSAASPRRFSLALHVGNAFLANIANLNFSGDFEFGWWFQPYWVAFVQVGATLVRTNNIGIPDQFGLVPSVIGVRRLYRIDRSFQPYWGFGLGLQLSVGDFAGLTAIPLPSMSGLVGFEYVFADRFSLGLEASTNVAQAVLGITHAGQGTGFNFDLNGTVAWRF